MHNVEKLFHSNSYRMSKSHLMWKIGLMAPLQAIPAVELLSSEADVRYFESFVLFWVLKNLFKKKKHWQILTHTWPKRCGQFWVVKPATFIVANFMQCGTMAFASFATVGKKKALIWEINSQHYFSYARACTGWPKFLMCQKFPRRVFWNRWVVVLAVRCVAN